jgi:hypothetical protein
MKKRKWRGNPNWGRFGKSEPVKPTEFEALATKNGIPQERWHRSYILREFAYRNANKRYVPEYLLKHWGITVDPEFASIY